MLLACSSLLATTWALSALDLLELELVLEELLELEELLANVNLLPGRVNLSSGCPGIFKPQSPRCLTFPIRKMSPAFLRPPKTKVRGLDLKYFPGQLISALPSKLFQSSGSTHSKVNTTATGGALRLRTSNSSSPVGAQQGEHHGYRRSTERPSPPLHWRHWRLTPTWLHV